MEISVTEAASLIGVDRSRVLRRLHSGELVGRKIGSVWLVDSNAVTRLARQSRPAGRPMSPTRAWALLDLLDGGDAVWLSPVARSQVRALIRDLAITETGDLASADRWRALLRARSDVVHTRAHPAALSRLGRGKDEGLSAGPRAAAAAGIDLVVLDPVEHLYVSGEQWRTLSAKWHIEEGVIDPNLIVHVPRRVWPFDRRDNIGVAALAADLLDSWEPRAVGAGVIKLNELARHATARARGRRAVRLGA